MNAATRCTQAIQGCKLHFASMQVKVTFCIPASWTKIHVKFYKILSWIFTNKAYNLKNTCHCLISDLHNHPSIICSFFLVLNDRPRNCPFLPCWLDMINFYPPLYWNWFSHFPPHSNRAMRASSIQCPPNPLSDVMSRPPMLSIYRRISVVAFCRLAHTVDFVDTQQPTSHPLEPTKDRCPHLAVKRL